MFQCSSGKTVRMTNAEFKDALVRGGDGDGMLKVNDWPQDQSFGDLLEGHHRDFMDMLPMSFMTHSSDAPLNLATYQPIDANKADLGPKVYIAQGQVRP